MTKEVEDIIRYKSWEELTGKERELLAEWADNAEEYSQMRWFLTETNTAFQKDKISASPDLRKGVMAQFDQDDRKPVIWFNAIGAFLLPEDKRIYQKPGFQLAAAAVLVVGFLWMFQMDWNEPEIAQNIPNEINVPPVKNDSGIDETTVDDVTTGEEENSQGLRQLSEGEEEQVSDRALFDEKPVMDRDRMDAFGEVAEIEEELNELPVPGEDGRIIFTEDIAMEDAADEIRDESKIEKDKVDQERKEMEAPGYMDDQVVDVEMNDAEADNATSVTRSKKTNLGRGVFSKREAANAVASEPLAVSENAEAAEEIMPKSLHINQTKELKSLFFTVK